MKALLTVFIALLPAALIAQTDSRLIVGADFEVLFDNMEASGSDIDRSGTVFSARLTPYVGWGWNERNRLVVGVGLRQDFGDSCKFLSDVKPIVYYRYGGERWSANAGIFPRHLLKGDYSPALFKQSWCYLNDRLMGFSATYACPKGMWEAAFSWDGMRSENKREQFRLISAGRRDFGDHFYLGYSAAMTHLALSARELPSEGVVDYIFLNPYVGTRFTAFFDFDVRAHLLWSYQNDRVEDNRKLPVGGQVDLSLAKWGFRLENDTYFGNNQLAFYEKYGSLLYGSMEFYATRRNIYNRTALSYHRSFFHETLSVGAAFEAHYEGKSVALQQIVNVKVNLEKIWKFK